MKPNISNEFIPCRLTSNNIQEIFFQRLFFPSTADTVDIQLIKHSIYYTERYMYKRLLKLLARVSSFFMNRKLLVTD